MKARNILIIGLLLVGLAACAPQVAEPTESDEHPLDGEAYVDSAELLIMESNPVQVSVHVTGNTPTPCHDFRYQYELQVFGETNRIDVTVYSESDPEASCTQVLEPFEETIPIPMEGQPEATYEVYVNGELVGEFSYPA